MTFPTPSGLGDEVVGTWVESPLYFDQHELTTGDSCMLFSNLNAACTDAYPSDRNQQGCWYLPGQMRDLYIGESGGHPAGLTTEMVGSKSIDWYSVTDLCFSQNATAPGTLPSVILDARSPPALSRLTGSSHNAGMTPPYLTPR